MQILRLLTINLVILLSFNVSADEAKNWLKTEIDKIIYAYPSYSRQVSLHS